MPTIKLSPACAEELIAALMQAPEDGEPPITPPVTPPPVDVSGFDRTHLIPLAWGPLGTGNVKVFSRNFGGFGHNEAIAVKFTTPATPQTSLTSLGAIRGVSNVDQPVSGRVCAISERAFDFTGAIAGPDTFGAMFSIGVDVVKGGVKYRRLECGRTYFFNVKNTDAAGNSTCAPGQSANVIVELYKPAGL